MDIDSNTLLSGQGEELRNTLLQPWRLIGWSSDPAAGSVSEACTVVLGTGRGADGGAHANGDRKSGTSWVIVLGKHCTAHPGLHVSRGFFISWRSNMMDVLPSDSVHLTRGLVSCKMSIIITKYLSLFFPSLALFFLLYSGRNLPKYLIHWGGLKWV